MGGSDGCCRRSGLGAGVGKEAAVPVLEALGAKIRNSDGGQASHLLSEQRHPGGGAETPCLYYTCASTRTELAVGSTADQGGLCPGTCG